MKHIYLDWLDITKFKSLEHFISLPGYLESINVIAKGPNASGKTTQLEAFTFLLNNKKNLKDNIIKTVEGVEKLLLKITENAGDKKTTIAYDSKKKSFSINNTEVKSTEYKQVMDEIFNGNWSSFSLLCSPDYFTSLERYEQKKVMLQFLKNNEKFKELYRKRTNRSFIPDSLNLKEQARAELKYISKLYDTFSVDEILKNPYVNEVELVKAAQLIKKHLATQARKNTDKVIELDAKLLEITNEENEIVATFNEYMSSKNLNFNIEIAHNDKGEDWLEIYYNEVPFKKLNTAQQLQIACLMCCALQGLCDLNAPIFVDNFERLDKQSRQTLGLLLGVRNIYAVEVA